MNASRKASEGVGQAHLSERHREHALTFVRRFAEGDIDALAPLLAEDVEVAGPLLRVTSKDDYLTALRADPPDRDGQARVMRVVEAEGEVTVWYEYAKPDAVLSITQHFRFSGTVISDMRLTFDAGVGW